MKISKEEGWKENHVMSEIYYRKVPHNSKEKSRSIIKAPITGGGWASSPDGTEGL